MGGGAVIARGDPGGWELWHCGESVAGDGKTAVVCGRVPPKVDPSGTDVYQSEVLRLGGWVCKGHTGGGDRESAGERTRAKEGNAKRKKD